MSRIAFLGLGAMGVRMARHLLDGHTVTVYNRTSARAEPLVAAGAHLAPTPKAAAEGADVIITMLTDDDAAEAVWLGEDGAIHSMQSGALAMECSTVTPAWIARLGEVVHSAGGRLLDAPVAGSTPQAEAAKLIFMAGGAEADFEEAKPFMERMGGKVMHVGALGHGATLKLVVNSLFASQVALMAELLQLVAGQGLDPVHITALLAQMPVTSPAAAGVAGLMNAGSHGPKFTTDLVIKDLRYAQSLGALPVVAAACARFEAASEAGLGAQNLTAVHTVS
ncbi:MAG: NAD(P)-dependent oxidoreductase [Bradymonadia bacterium]